MTTNPAPDLGPTAFGPPHPDTGPQPQAQAQPQAQWPAPFPVDGNGTPVFGRRKSENVVKRIPFALATYDSAGHETQNPLTARADIDTASVFSLGRTGQNLGAQIDAIRKLLMRVLVDDDGIGVHDRVEQVVPRPNSSDNDDDDGDEDLVPVADLPEGATVSMSDVGFRTPDGHVFDTSDEAAAHCREHGSSLRRFAAIMDDDSLWVEQSALEEIIDYLMAQAADRPTRRSSARSRSRQRTGR